jgi:hypothetical protein
MAKIVCTSVIVTGFLAVGQNAISFEEDNTVKVLENFKNSLSWIESASMKVDVVSTTGGTTKRNPVKFIYALHRDYGRFEWDGTAGVLNSDGNIDPNKSAILRSIITSEKYIVVTGNPGRPPLGASITTKFNEEKENLLDSDVLGGPVFRKTSGINHKNVSHLLTEANDLRLRQGQEDVNGTACYVLEGTTKYGKVTAWIAPTKGYVALKWKVEKTGDDLIDDKPMSKTQLTMWIAQFECKQTQQIGASYIPKTATFECTSKSKDGSSNLSLDVYNISDVQLHPDFDALGAFKIALPEGTRITIPESPGVKYIWKDGKAVPVVDGPTFDDIDKTIDGL